MTFSLDARIYSEIGLVRKNNQDSGYVSPRLLLVADGMGGAAAGDLASAVAVRALSQTDEAHQGPAMLEALAGSLANANDEIADLVAWDHRLVGMGTTVTGALFDGEQVGLIHIGDSRCYLIRDGELTRLTRDHSFVQALVDEGKITAAEAADHPHRSLLLRVLNGEPSHRPDLALVDVQLGDRLLFCSDGLCGLVNDHDIATIVGIDDLDAAVRALVAAAHEQGGSDNITVVLADVVGQSEQLDAAPARVVGAATTIKIPDVPIGSAQLDGGAAAELRDAEGDPASRAPVPGDLGVSQADPDVREALIDADGEERLRYAPTVRSKRRSWIGILAILAGLALLTAGVGFGGKAYLASHYYIGPNDQTVAIYQGLPDEVLGFRLWQLNQASSVRIDDLPPYYAQAVRDQRITPPSLEAARTTVAELEQKARICIAKRAAAAPQPGGVPSVPGVPGVPEVPGPETPSAPEAPASSPSDPTSPDPEACA